MQTRLFVVVEMSRVVKNAFYIIDTVEWPIVAVRFQRAPVEDDEIDGFQARFLAVLELARKGSLRVPKTKLYIAMNLDGIVDASLRQQFKAADFIRDVRPYVFDVVAATGLTVSSPLVRTIFTAITAVQPLASLHEIFEEEASALSWLRKHMDGQQPQEAAVVPILTNTVAC